MHLRPFLKQLEEQQKLVRITKEVSVEYEIANIMYSINEKPVIFENVKGYPFPVFGGITSDRDIIAQGLGTTKEKLLQKLVEALRHPTTPELVDNAPCQEVKI
jgi:UbiD family decarboxylase